MATNPGDGKTNPFGNGKGDTSMGPSKGVDFQKDPQGAGQGGKKGRDILAEPAPKQQMGSNENKDSVPQGGKILKADPKDKDGGNPVGTTPDGAAHKPFKLSGE